MLLNEFFAQHVEGKLAPKTVERYREQAEYLDPSLREMLIEEINRSTSLGNGTGSWKVASSQPSSTRLSGG